MWGDQFSFWWPRLYTEAFINFKIKNRQERKDIWISLYSMQQVHIYRRSHLKLFFLIDTSWDISLVVVRRSACAIQSSTEVLIGSKWLAAPHLALVSRCSDAEGAPPGPGRWDHFTRHSIKMRLFYKKANSCPLSMHADFVQQIFLRNSCKGR